MSYKVGFLALLSSFVMSFGFVAKADFRPPGTAEIVDNFFYDVSEISNGDWREYLSDVAVNEGKESTLYQNTIPDTTVWSQEESYNDPYVREYFRHPAYSTYPVVGISQKQAMDYCAWRTQAVKIMLEANGIDGPVDLSYRLPSQTEWELMAEAGYDARSKRLIDKKIAEMRKRDKHARVAKVNMMMKSRTQTDNHDNIDKVPAPGKSYLPNKFGIYNINGNVAEMVREPGIAMGGSFTHYYEDIVPTNKPVKYDKPEKWLGFRCVCEVTQR